MFYDALALKFQEHANAENAFHMKAYMRNKFEFYGIKAGLRRQLMNGVFSLHNEEVKSTIRKLVYHLYDSAYREMHLCAMELFQRTTKRSMIEEDLEIIEYLIVTNSWWDTVDYIAKQLLGQYLKLFPDKRTSVLSTFSSSPDLWLNRSTILFQLGYKDQTDEKILFKQCSKFKDSKEFFLQKAIGWALREYAKTNPKAVLNFVNSTQLKSLSRREAIRNIA
ncbi:MAG: DNA alkylation repair protein [Flavobacteriaceae bacterium]|nr:DNA alkylation repair protein [Bacteroidia bacterium]MBT8287194.1 DNA alkylation repair protein [Bacteroidia bacterium]NNF74711.1 DNA alkylation repair protein [Flavobacteriaceae bacterium]NNK71876.1 DNA alkylation repair protein [Flavobacteriaceae bacterium]